MDANLQALSQAFICTLSPAPEPRRQAERTLLEHSLLPGHAIAVLRLSAEPSADDQVRHAAAVHFKNYVRDRWAPSDAEDAGGGLPPVPDGDKAQIKAILVGFMLAAPPRVQSQLAEALAAVGRHDFPGAWPSLLPDLAAGLLGATNYAAVNGVLAAANAIFKKFRYEFKTNDLMADLKYCLDGFAAPLLETFTRTANNIAGKLASSPEELRPLVESQRLCCRIFYSLNYQDLPEYFEDHMKEWMSVFQSYLTTPFLTLEADKNGVQLVDGLRAAICDNIRLYLERYEEEFQDYLTGFASAVWNLLLGVSISASRDEFAVTGINFLTSISTSVHHSIFGAPSALEQIFTSVIIPNVRLREEEEELFEFNYVEYIRRDSEGSDSGTRRRAASELLKGLVMNFKDQINQLVLTQMNSMLALYGQNPAGNWKEKDCAIYLVIAMATKKDGGSSSFTDLVNVEKFVNEVILPELKSPDVNGLPVLKACAIRFFTTFQSQIPKSAALPLVPDVIRFLGSESNVVHSYAAICVEKLLLVRDAGQPRYSLAEMSPLLPALMTNLFNALQFPESKENQHIMKCIMRVLRLSNISGEVAGICIDRLTAILLDVCKNPTNPVFNHYLFEAVAASIKRSCEQDASLVPLFEIKLFPALQKILADDVSEFWPYTFQIFAQLVELNKPPLRPEYMQLFSILLADESWNRPGNVPALVRLLQAYLQKTSHELNRDGRLSQVLGRFDRLIESKNTSELGFYILNTVIENLSYDVIAPHVGQIWNAIFTRLQSNKSAKYVKSLVIFMSLFLIKYGHEALVNSINALQPDLFSLILDQFWITHLKNITGFIEVKLAVVAATTLICESPALLGDNAALMCGRMLDSIITLLARPEQDRVEVEPDLPDVGENIGYSARFVQLYNAGKKEDDPLKNVKDPKEFFMRSLASLSARYPGKYLKIIREAVGPENQEHLKIFCASYNCTIS